MDDKVRLYVYEETSGLYIYTRVFENNERPGSGRGWTEIPVQQLFLDQGQLAFFRNGQWEYEPDPDWVDPNEIKEEIADDQ